MVLEICEICKKKVNKKGMGNHRAACRKREELEKQADLAPIGKEASIIQEKTSDQHNDSLQNLKDVKIEGKPPEIHNDSVPPELKAPAHQEDRKEKEPDISVSQGNEISEYDPDRKEENDGDVIWGAVAAFAVLMVSIIAMIWLWWKNRNKEGAT